MAAVNDSVDTVAELAADTLIPSLVLELRSMAHGQGWPARLVSSLDLAYEDGSIVIKYPDELAEEIENLEYGDINSLPLAVIRPFTYRSIGHVNKVIRQQSVGALFVALGVV